MSKAEGGLQIVVADDNTFMANSLKVLLELWGHSVTPTYDGRAALSLICDLRPDVALLDLRMPMLDGLEVARRVRAESDPRTVVLVAVTGSADPSDRARTRAAGFDEHLVKPIDLQELRTMLRRPLRGREPARSGEAAVSTVGRRPVV